MNKAAVASALRLLVSAAPPDGPRRKALLDKGFAWRVEDNPVMVLSEEVATGVSTPIAPTLDRLLLPFANGEWRVSQILEEFDKAKALRSS